MDYYWFTEAKRREQERIEEAQAWHLQKWVREMQTSRLTVLRSDMLSWLGARLVASGTNLQARSRYAVQARNNDCVAL